MKNYMIMNKIIKTFVITFIKQEKIEVAHIVSVT